MENLSGLLALGVCFGVLLGIGLILNWLEAHGPSFPGAAQRKEKRRKAQAEQLAGESKVEREARMRKTRIDFLRYQGLTKRAATERVDSQLAMEAMRDVQDLITSPAREGEFRSLASHIQRSLADGTLSEPLRTQLEGAPKDKSHGMDPTPASLNPSPSASGRAS